MHSQRLSEMNSPGNTTFLLSGLISFLLHGVHLEHVRSPVRVRVGAHVRCHSVRFVADVLWCTGEGECTLVGRLCSFLFKRNYSCVNRTETPDAEPHY